LSLRNVLTDIPQLNTCDFLKSKYIRYRLVKKISSVFPEAKQIKELGLENNTDYHIWKFAKDNNYTIVTFDADFFELSSATARIFRVVL
jgi:predicted nuclease of predicted toxin-antitoxin system